MSDRPPIDDRLFSEACERNKEPIAAQLERALPERGTILEIGSGTGQHAAYFASRFASLLWQPTDLGERFASVRAWTAEQDNVLEPIVFDLLAVDPPVPSADAIVCINTIHIAPWEATEHLFRHAAKLLPKEGTIFLYGPFRYRDRPLEPSNERFDAWLQGNDPRQGIRTFEDVDAIARRYGFELQDDVPMPANNRSIWWRRREHR